MDIHSPEVLIAGGGIGGLAAAVALARQGAHVQILEQASAFAEVGAGVQLGPNVTRILRDWGLASPLKQVATFPQEVQVRDARSGRVLGSLPLGERVEHCYGAPYACIHRADLHGLLLRQTQACGVPVHLDQQVTEVRSEGQYLTVHTAHGWRGSASLLVGADGLWSRTRQALGLHDPPRFLGHLAYRGLLPCADPSEPARVTLWLGPRLHIVHYPVQAGRALNVVAIVEGPVPAQAQDWDQAAHAAQLWRALGPVCDGLAQTLQVVPAWRLWPLYGRPVLSAASHMGKAVGQGAVALLGDAAHPMPPYLAQGAGMAIEDAHVLAQCWSSQVGVPERVNRYAQQRWRRNAQVQARALRNGKIFHAQGPLAWARDAGLRVLGERLMDLPWLYGPRS